MTLEEMMNDADAVAFLDEIEGLAYEILVKGYCFMCEGYKCRCEEFGLLD